MAEDIPVEDYPTEIEEQLTGFESSVGTVNNMVQTILSMPRNELVQKLDPLEQAKLDLMSAYSLNSLFWMYLVTQGINPKEHAIKQELERIRTYMNRVKEITDRRKAARLNKAAMSRFLRNALWKLEEGRSKDTPGCAPQDTPGCAPQDTPGRTPQDTPGRAPQHTPGRGHRTPGRGHRTPGRGHRTPGRGHHTPGRGQHKSVDGHQSKGPKLS
ncbi:nuclear nucleic acid-binding protein C1D [Salmo salar]|uniref:Nuclear nucleic acid-binding protein C1D n=1 Tax=Salmo salar TaxID=8030 RepID=B5XEG9_SALSA|nr:nuclear nucleic acid-binding protein C1D [Salmo salar]ACI69239.1 Nuclear nucleic acid-binding protein C1D [Salmo salar]|eukprot:NP_001135361.1 nuclear nucleic acid-binding protein C1D [Salmo salar]